MINVCLFSKYLFRYIPYRFYTYILQKLQKPIPSSASGSIEDISHSSSSSSLPMGYTRKSRVINWQWFGFIFTIVLVFMVVRYSFGLQSLDICPQAMFEVFTIQHICIVLLFFKVLKIHIRWNFFYKGQKSP